jgi:hypothetical protein
MYSKWSFINKKMFLSIHFFNIEPFDLFSESKDLLELVNNNKESHFFLDEVHVSQNQIPSKVLAEISNIISKDNFLWIACQSDRLPTKTDSNLKGKIVHICLIFCSFSAIFLKRS